MVLLIEKDLQHIVIDKTRFWVLKLLSFITLKRSAGVICWEETGLIDREILIQSSIKSSLTALLIRVPVIIANLIGLYNRKCVWSGV